MSNTNILYTVAGQSPDILVQVVFERHVAGGIACDVLVVKAPVEFYLSGWTENKANLTPVESK